jgi:hypothetical protein
MKRGFELLKTRSLTEALDIPSIEERYNIRVPPLYRLFCETFHLGDDSILVDKYINPKNTSDLRYCSFYSYIKDREVRFAGFNSLENALEYSKNTDEWIENKYIPIGHVGFNGAILLGTTESDADKIILHNFDLSPEYTTLASDIFQFVRELVLEPIPENDLAGGVTFSLLYKNWNEDFWRINEES